MSSKNFNYILDRERKNLEEFEKVISYSYSDKKLLLTALCHSTFINELSDGECYERLEFLGDSILSFVTAEYLYNNYRLAEGSLTKLRSKLVSEESLFRVAEHFNVKKYVLLGKTFLHEKGGVPVSILADVIEAIIASIYEDSGLGNAKVFTINFLKFLLSNEELLEAEKDYKSLLQELVQYRYKILPEYRTIKICEGEERFRSDLFVKSKLIASAEAPNTKLATKLVAKKAYETLKANKKKFSN